MSSSNKDTIVVGVLCIQGAFIEHIAHLKKVAEIKKDVHVSVVEVRCPEQLHSLDGLIIPGGESTTLNLFLGKNQFMQALRQWTKRQDRPTVTWGTCAGLIVLADELSNQKTGGQTTVSRTFLSFIVNQLRSICSSYTHMNMYMYMYLIAVNIGRTLIWLIGSLRCVRPI